MNISGNLFYRGNIINAGLKIEDGIVKEIGKKIKGKEIKGIILPSAIDVHVHLRDFKEKHKETIKSGTLSALCGGVCLVVDQPNTSPRIEEKIHYGERIEKAARDSYVGYRLNMGLTLNNSRNIKKIVNEIRSDLKCHIPAIGEVFIEHSDPKLQIDYEVLKKAREKTDIPITVHAEDPSFIKSGRGPNFETRPPQAEINAVNECLKRGDFHFCHVSTEESLNLISSSNSTLEVTPHHLILSIKDWDRLKNLINVNPPLRERKTPEALLKRFKDINVVASDHAPHSIEEKINGAPGFPGVETMYPLLINLVREGFLDLKDVVERLSITPAKIFSFKNFGEIEVGNYANFSVFELSDVRKIKPDYLHSLAGWTPYENYPAIFPKKVFLKGVLAVDSGEVLIRPGEINL